jgi:magnesium-transporting ATPase (P-type)
MGKIATILSETDEAKTPLQDKLNEMAKTLGVICIITCAMVFGIGFLYNFLNKNILFLDHLTMKKKAP